MGNLSGREVLIALSLKCQGDWTSMYNAIKNRVDIGDVDAAALPTNAITIVDPDYPESLKRVNHPPFVLWYGGDASLLGSKGMAALSGNADPSSYGARISKEIGAACAAHGVVLAAKLAKGCCAAALWNGALAHGRQIVVLSEGIDRGESDGKYSAIREKVLREGGLLISEYPDGVPQSARTSLESCRIVAGLGSVLIVPQTGRNAPSTVIVAEALNVGCDVAVAPHRIGDDCLNNELIADGAYPLYDLDRFFRDFFPTEGK